jgi:hypothetical protein
MKTLLLIFMAALVGCTNLPVAMPNNQVSHATMVGGKGTLAYDSQGRPVYTYNNENSLQHFFQFATTTAGVGFAAWGAQAKTASDNALSATKDSNALKSHINDNATTLQLDANAKKAANDALLLNAGHYKTP